MSLLIDALEGLDTVRVRQYPPRAMRRTALGRRQVIAPSRVFGKGVGAQDAQA